MLGEFISQSLFETLLHFERAQTHVRAYDPKIVRGRDAQCGTKELP